MAFANDNCQALNAYLVGGVIPPSTVADGLNIPSGTPTLGLNMLGFIVPSSVYDPATFPYIPVPHLHNERGKVVAY